MSRAKDARHPVTPETLLISNCLSAKGGLLATESYQRWTLTDVCNVDIWCWVMMEGHRSGKGKSVGEEFALRKLSARGSVFMLGIQG